jgi:uncharacterized membrane protein YczE
MKILSVKSVPITRWSSDRPLNLSPKPLTLFMLCIGLALFGLGESLIITASVGMSPWTVLAEGLSLKTGLGIGILTFLISLSVLLLWLPLKQSAGIGTLLNVIIIASVIAWSLPYLPHPESYFISILQAVIGTLIVGLGSGIYLIANLGPGPRDGLMTGCQRLTGFPIASVRILLELSVISIGWSLGGTIGFGTIIFALGVGPSVSIWIYCISAISKN